MKKRLIQLALILGLMTLTCVAAQATEPTPTSGLKNIDFEVGGPVQLFALDAAGRTAIADIEDNTVYPGAAKVGVTYKSPTKDSEYLLIVLSDNDATPSVDNMAYIDQKTASGSDLDFTIYPKKTTEASVTYSVYMSSNDGTLNYSQVGSFEYYSTGLDVTLGDVNDDGKINVPDAVLVLQAYVGKKELDDAQFIAADVTKDGKVTVPDAVKILQYYVGKITSFD